MLAIPQVFPYVAFNSSFLTGARVHWSGEVSPSFVGASHPQLEWDTKYNRNIGTKLVFFILWDCSAIQYNHAWSVISIPHSHILPHSPWYLFCLEMFLSLLLSPCPWLHCVNSTGSTPSRWREFSELPSPITWDPLVLDTPVEKVYHNLPVHQDKGVTEDWMKNFTLRLRKNQKHKLVLRGQSV